MKTKIIAFIGISSALIICSILLVKNDDKTQQIPIQTEDPPAESAKVLGASTADQNDVQKVIFEKIDVIKAKDIIAQSAETIKIIDIRTSEEFLAGHIEKSANIDYYGSFEEEIEKLDKNNKYLIYCKSGNRSGQALKIFEKLGFKEVYDLEGGYIAWTAQ